MFLVRPTACTHVHLKTLSAFICVAAFLHYSNSLKSVLRIYYCHFTESSSKNLFLTSWGATLMLDSSPWWNASLGYSPSSSPFLDVDLQVYHNGLARCLDLSISTNLAKPSLQSILWTSMNSLLGYLLVSSIWIRAATTENLDGCFNFFKPKIF